MSIIKPNNNTISAITALPAAITTGKVLQVVQATDSTTFTSTSSSYAASGDIISITPSATSSKILIFFSYNVWRGGHNGNIFGKIYRDINGGGYSEVESSARGLHQNNGYVGTTPILQKCSMTYLDSPNTTSQVNYQTYFRNESTSNTFEVGEGGGHTTAMQVMEIAG